MKSVGDIECAGATETERDADYGLRAETRTDEIWKVRTRVSTASVRTTEKERDADDRVRATVVICLPRAFGTRKRKYEK